MGGLACRRDAARPQHTPQRNGGDTSRARSRGSDLRRGSVRPSCWRPSDGGQAYLGLSLWNLAGDWLAPDDAAPLAFLPSRLWMIGLGNLGQAFAWLIATLPFTDPSDVQIILQDFDRIAKSNDSTSLLSFSRNIGRRKVRVVADWLDRLGFDTYLEERRFGAWTKRTENEPGVALCGVDNAEARAALEDAGFDLVIEAGLGGGTEAFRSISLHSFPATRTARAIWTKTTNDAVIAHEDLPAYKALRDAGMDECGLAQLASRTVGVPVRGPDRRLSRDCGASPPLARRDCRSSSRRGRRPRSSSRAARPRRASMRTALSRLMVSRPYNPQGAQRYSASWRRSAPARSRNLLRSNAPHPRSRAARNKALPSECLPPSFGRRLVSRAPYSRFPAKAPRSACTPGARREARDHARSCA